MPDDVIIATLTQFREADVPTSGGRTTAYVYDPGIEGLEELGVRAYAVSQHVNGLDPTAFPSYASVENDLVAACAELLGGDADTVGTLTSGGTESCALAVLGARERWRARGGQGRPHLIAPSSAHPAFRKAAHLFDLEYVAVPIDPASGKADVAAMVAAIDAQTALVVVSFPSYPLGVTDPVEPIAAAALAADVPCHLDACIGGFTLPFIREAEGLEPIDLRTPGITSVSVDIHKYGYAPKGASVLLHRNTELRRWHWFSTADWPGYPVVNPTLLSTRPGGPPAVAWAVVHRIGLQGYRRLALAARSVVVRIADGISGIEGLRVVGEPEATLIAFTDTGGDEPPDVLVVADEMTARGWLVGAQPPHSGLPQTVHVSASAVLEDSVDAFLADLRDSVEAARLLPRATPDPNLVAFAAAMNPADLTPDLIGAALAGLGIGGEGGGLPERMAPINALMGALPPAITERLLVEILGGIYTHPRLSRG
jgi:glutamate/tyrosine decarboxylase-like PLP-dependent enzyme